MKIVFLEAVQEYGGAQIATLELASRLSSQHEVMLIDCYGACVPFVNAVRKKGLQISVISPRTEPYVIFRYASIFRNLISVLCYIPHWVGLRIKLKKLLSEIGPDFVVVYNTKVLSLLESRERSKYCSVYYAHGWYIPKQISRLTRYCLKKRVNKILCISEATRQALYANNISSLENMYVVHNAIDEKNLPLEVAYVPGSERCFKILHSGAFVPDKGIHVSLEIAKVLKERKFDFKLVVTGLVYHGAVSELYYQDIKRKVTDYGLDDHVIIVRDKTNVIDYFRSCDVLIHPSATEGLPLVIMEAMMLKKPVIANAVGGVTDLILHAYTGLLPHYNDVNEYADCIMRLKTDRPFYCNISENAYRLIQDSFSVEDQLHAFYKLFGE